MKNKKKWIYLWNKNDDSLEKYAQIFHFEIRRKEEWDSKIT